MALAVKVRCVVCDRQIQAARGTCPVCQSNQWEDVITQDVLTGIPERFIHPVARVAYWAYDEGAQAGIQPPAWAAAGIPASSAYGRRRTLESRVDDYTALKNYLAATSPSSAQTAAALKVLIRFVLAMARLWRGRLDAVD